MSLLKRFWSEEEGLETVEWAILAAIIAGGLVTAITAIATAVGTRFNTLKTAVGG